MKQVILCAALTASLILSGCASKIPATNAIATTIAQSTTAESTEAESTKATSALPFDRPQLVFNQDISPMLGSDDDYTLTLSAFDYAAKFKSDKTLTERQRADAFKNAMEVYSESEIEKLNDAFDAVFSKMGDMTIRLPETIVVFSEETIEGGAAYTRGNAICMPKRIVSSASLASLKDLAAHELFHVISRYNKELRPQMYGLIGYTETMPLTIPQQLVDLTIANPDAPDNNYTITCNYLGKSTLFMPILYSKTAYPAKSNLTFFSFLNDDLLAVKLVDQVPQAILEDGKPVIVKKNNLPDYAAQIGKNTDYTFHPEETTADHFMLLIRGHYSNLPNPEKIDQLNQILTQ